MNDQFMTVPSVHWAAAINFEQCNAYEATNRVPLLPQPDIIYLNDALVDKIYHIGISCTPIHQRDAALPVVKVEIMADSDEVPTSDLWDIADPKSSLVGELSIYGISLLFSASSGELACDIAFDYSDHCGGGYEEIGTVGIMADGDNFFTFPHYLRDLSGIDLYDFESLTKLSNWLGYLWRGIQHLIINRPEVIHIRHQRIPRAARESIEKIITKKGRIVKVQRVISISLDEEDKGEIRHTGGHQITLSIWSVSGHWRELKSGKRIWIAPYYKGKNREKQKSDFDRKEYRFNKEVFEYA